MERNGPAKLRLRFPQLAQHAPPMRVLAFAEVRSFVKGQCFFKHVANQIMRSP